jgi:Rrf2 family iron-sulfur cluster assembly transcriptional regulator
MLKARHQYALLALFHLAHDGERVTLNLLAERIHCSFSYLEQIFADLRAANLVIGLRGPGGGYVLARFPEQITVAEVVRALEDAVADRRYRRQATPALEFIEASLDNALARIVLSDLDFSDLPLRQAA